MNETITTIVGNVVDTPSTRNLDSGLSVTSFRVASTSRRFDRVTGSWTDGDSLFLKVTCWRALAENTAACVVKGDPVVVHGRLYSRTYEVAESRRASYELEATAIGFDLNRGRGSFKRFSASRGATVDDVGPDGFPTGGAVDAHIETGIRFKVPQLEPAELEQVDEAARAPEEAEADAQAEAGATEADLSPSDDATAGGTEADDEANKTERGRTPSGYRVPGRRRGATPALA